MKQTITRSQAGDTIVEVLIAIAIVATILVGAFYVSNQSTSTVQDNQEHTEAQQILQSQVEALRAFVLTSNAVTLASNLPDHSANVCMDGSTPRTVASGICESTIGGTTVQPKFSRDGDRYTFTIDWSSIKGGHAHEQFVYVVYPKTS